MEKAHGRIERRSIWVSSELKGYLNFPHAEQVFTIKRETELLSKGTSREEVVCCVTSLSVEKADAARLLELNRGHWEIENRVHYLFSAGCSLDISPHFAVWGMLNAAFASPEAVL